MNICVVTQQYGKVLTGPGLHARLLVDFLVRAGHAVWVICPAGQADRSLPGTLVPVADPWVSKNQARWFFTARSFAQQIARLRREQAFDLYHFIDARDGLFCGSLTPKIGNINDVYATRLESWSYYRKQYRDWLLRGLYYHVAHWAEGIAYRHFDLLIANSQFTLDTIREAYPPTAGKLRLLYKAVDTARYRAAGIQPLSQRKRQVLFVGANMERKGIWTLLEAAKIVLSREAHIDFLCVGGDAKAPLFAAAAQRMGIGDHVHFPGWRDQDALRDLYRESAVYVLPSLTESLGVSIVEAMAAGTPVIGSDVGGIPEIITDRETGLLVPPGEAQELAEAILVLLTDAQLAQKLTANALERISRFDAQTMLEGTLRLYEELNRMMGST